MTTNSADEGQGNSPAPPSVSGGAPHRAPPPSAAWAALLDGLLIIGALAMATWLRSWGALTPMWQALGAANVPFEWGNQTSALALFQVASILTLLWALDQYQLLRNPTATWSYNRVLLAATLSMGTLLGILFVLEVAAVPRAVLILDFLLTITLLSAWRERWQIAIRRRHMDGRELRNVVLVGSGPLQQHLAQTFVEDALLGRRVVGFLTDDPERVMENLPPEWANRSDILMSTNVLELSPLIAKSVQEQPRHILAPIATLDQQAIANALEGLLVEEVYIGSDVPREVARQVLIMCQKRGLGAHLVPDHYAELGIEPRAWNAGPYTLLDVHQRPLSRLAWIAKRGMDVAGGLAGLVIGAPFLLLAAIAIKIEDRHMPVFYRGTRVGLKGRTFGMVKLTTMRLDAQVMEMDMQQENQREGPWFKVEAAADPRLTRVGRVLRKFSINEIPQFWNVLAGDMSLVGPRPPIPAEVASYVEYDFGYFRCLDVRPGITGLWQVTCKNDPSFDRRIELDTHYIHHWSVWMDIKILFLTIWTVVREPEE